MVEQVTMYRVVCDGCLCSAQGGDYYAWVDEEQARIEADDAGWRVIDGKDYCDDCWVVDEETDEPKVETNE